MVLQLVHARTTSHVLPYCPYSFCDYPTKQGHVGTLAGGEKPQSIYIHQEENTNTKGQIYTTLLQILCIAINYDNRTIWKGENES